jgi:hypothetical protein
MRRVHVARQNFDARRTQAASDRNVIEIVVEPLIRDESAR